MRGIKEKYSKEYIIGKALEYVNKKGKEEFTVRNLSKYIGISTQPIFRHFDSFLDLQNALVKEIELFYESYMEKYILNHKSGFKSMGFAYINFAKDHPNYFEELLLKNYFNKNSFSDFFSNDEGKEIIFELSKITGIKEENSKKLLRNMWLLSHGMATMIFRGQTKYDEVEIEEIFNDTFQSQLIYFKNKK